jgi:hypothetical protein
MFMMPHAIAFMIINKLSMLLLGSIVQEEALLLLAIVAQALFIVLEIDIKK